MSPTEKLHKMVEDYLYYSSRFDTCWSEEDKTSYDLARLKTVFRITDFLRDNPNADPNIFLSDQRLNIENQFSFYPDFIISLFEHPLIDKAKISTERFKELLIISYCVKKLYDRILNLCKTEFDDLDRMQAFTWATFDDVPDVEIEILKAIEKPRQALTYMRLKVQDSLDNPEDDPMYERFRLKAERTLFVLNYYLEQLYSDSSFRIGDEEMSPYELFLEGFPKLQAGQSMRDWVDDIARHARENPLQEAGAEGAKEAKD